LKESLPTGAATVTVHVSAPAVLLQFGDPGVRFAVVAGPGVAVPLAIAMAIDCVLGETNAGLRAFADAPAPAGIVI
jgi:hypothetical protein